MSFIEEKLRQLKLSETQVEALKSAAQEGGRLGAYLSPQTERALYKKRLAQGGYLTPFGVSVREYLVAKRCS